eukprot:1744081-Karenia_brevis.AAC.1
MKSSAMIALYLFQSRCKLLSAMRRHAVTTTTATTPATRRRIHKEEPTELVEQRVRMRLASGTPSHREEQK